MIKLTEAQYRQLQHWVQKGLNSGDYYGTRRHYESRAVAIANWLNYIGREWKYEQ